MANLQIVPERKNVEAQYVEMRVPLYSYGCERKVKKALAQLRGIYSVNVDFNEQKVTVWGICNKYDVLATVRKKRKETCFWNTEETAQPRKTPPSPCPMRPRSMPSSTLAKARSLSWKAWKKVFFIRSNSF